MDLDTSEGIGYTESHHYICMCGTAYIVYENYQIRFGGENDTQLFR